MVNTVQYGYDYGIIQITTKVYLTWCYCSLPAGQYISLRTLSSSWLGMAGTSVRQGSWWISDLWVDLCWLYRRTPLQGGGGGRVGACRSSSHTCWSDSLVSVARILIQVKRDRLVLVTQIIATRCYNIKFLYLKSNHIKVYRKKLVVLPLNQKVLYLVNRNIFQIWLSIFSRLLMKWIKGYMLGLCSSRLAGKQLVPEPHSSEVVVTLLHTHIRPTLYTKRKNLFSINIGNPRFFFCH